MAKTEPAPANQPTPLQLSTNDIMGAIQRGLMELHSYLTYVEPAQVNPAIIEAYLERSWQFAQTLPKPAENANAAKDRKAG